MGCIERPFPDIDFSLPVLFASDCSECPDCGEPWCDECKMHYSECRHPGPDSEKETEQ